MTKVKKAPPVKAAEPETEEIKVKNVNPAIASEVLNLLGKPKNLYDIVVKPLWDNRYRVNVWCHVTEDGREVTPLYDPKLITDSFFIHSNPVGDIIASSPKINKKYDENNPIAKMNNNNKKYNISDIMKP